MSQQTVEINFNGTKYVSKDSHFLVFGFIREHQLLVSDLIIPSPIYLLCLMYYYLQNYFGIHSSRIQVTGDQNETITSKESKDSCAYGYHWIHSMSNKLITYKIKINHGFNAYQDSDIGISASDTFIDEDFASSTNIYYAFDADGDKWSVVDDVSFCQIYDEEFDDGYKAGDIVTMQLDLFNSTISFYVNDRFKGIAFDDIKKGENIRYKLAVMLAKSGDSCTIIEYSEVIK